MSDCEQCIIFYGITVGMKFNALYPLTSSWGTGDVSGNMNHGNARFTQTFDRGIHGEEGGATYFPGDSSIRVPSPPGSNLRLQSSNVTFSGFYKTDDPPMHGFLVEFRQGTEIFLLISGSIEQEFKFNVILKPDNYWLSVDTHGGDPFFPKNEWVFFTASYNYSAAEVSVWKNGVFLSSRTENRTSHDHKADGDLTIGNTRWHLRMYCFNVTLSE